MIRIDALWLATEPLDMRAGTESALTRVVAVFGAARPHHAYLFANRMKVLVHDGIGVWLAARRLNSGKFVWPREGALTATLSRPRAADPQVRYRKWEGPGLDRHPRGLHRRLPQHGGVQGDAALQVLDLRDDLHADHWLFKTAEHFPDLDFTYEVDNPQSSVRYWTDIGC